MTWNEKLTQLRTAQGISQADLGAAIGLQASRISRWEKGEGAPSMEQGLGLARALGVDYDYFADDAQDEPPPSQELADDERSALDLYREIRAQLGNASALKELAKLAALAESRVGGGNEPPSAPVPAPSAPESAPRSSSPWVGVAVRNRDDMSRHRKRMQEEGEAKAKERTKGKTDEPKSPPKK
jgi:transcriptional regulator with XRE-family HTH domain